MTDLTSGAHLTTSRVNRLLRPLRNKCYCLASLPKSAAAPYSKHPFNWDPDSRPPLIVLCAPASTKKLSLDRGSADEFELSRRIYAVCDTFKNIAHVAYGQPCDRRIPSLAAMCALVIGRSMPAADSDTSLVSSGEESTDENDQLDMDGIYEAVPPHYRRFLIMSHALSMILRVCTHHHTLVIILLGHSLTFGLVHESTRLLNIILAQAFLPSNSSRPPPTTHPAHTNYLLDLHAKWTAGNKPPSGSLLFTTSTFCNAVLNNLLQYSFGNSHILWTSKVLNRLFHVVENCDLDSYIVIIYTLSRSFWEISGSSPNATGDATQPVMLRDRLSELMSHLFDLLFTQSDSHPSLLTPPRIYATTSILHECYIAQLHHLRLSAPGSPTDLPDMITVFATQIFVATRNSAHNSDCTLAILDDSSPVPATFSKLMMYFGRLQDTRSFGDFMEAFLTQLRKYSTALCSERLFNLDASLLACALHYFETSVANSKKGSPTLVAKYKGQIMEAVDAAEHRCFGGDLDNSSVIPLSLCSSHAKRTKRGRLSGHWEWEDMVGSWIRRTPVYKKQKFDNGRIPSLRGTVDFKASSGSISTSTPLPTLVCSRLLPTLSPSSSSHPSETDAFDYQGETDKENYPSSPPPVTKMLRSTKRRSSNFLSLLADAQTNRIALHPKSRPDPKPPSSGIPEKYLLPSASQVSRHAPPMKEQKASCSKAPLRIPSRTLFPSDDSLDLFACATSSPTRC